MGHVTMKGSVKQVCDEIEAWYTEKACDGFNINTPVMPRSLNDFVDLVQYVGAEGDVDGAEL